MDPRTARLSVDKLRALRVPAPRDLSLGARLAGEVLDAKKRQKAVGGIGVVWAELLADVKTGGGNDSLAERTIVRSFLRGLLTIEASDTATRYQVDRWLRGGGLELLRKRSPRTLTRVKLV